MGRDTSKKKWAGRFGLSSALMTAALVLTGCNDAQFSPSSGDTRGVSTKASLGDDASDDLLAGNLQIFATRTKARADEPAVSLAIKEVALRVKGGDFTALAVDSLTLDLSSLQSGSLSSLVQAPLAAGTYDQIKFVFASATITKVDGTQETVTFSEEDESQAADEAWAAERPPRRTAELVFGIRTELAVDETSVSHLVVDFSQPERGPLAGRQERRPERRDFSSGTTNEVAVADGESERAAPPLAFDLDLTGAVSGLVSAANDQSEVAKARIEIFQDGKLIADALTDDSGIFIVIGLDPGSYTVRVRAKDFAPTEMADIVIEDGSTTAADVSLSSAASSASPSSSPMPQASPIQRRHRQMSH